jgi:hypothetical protein
MERFGAKGEISKSLDEQMYIFFYVFVICDLVMLLLDCANCDF